MLITAAEAEKSKSKTMRTSQTRPRGVADGGGVLIIIGGSALAALLLWRQPQRRGHDRIRVPRFTRLPRRGRTLVPATAPDPTTRTPIYAVCLAWPATTFFILPES